MKGVLDLAFNRIKMLHFRLYTTFDSLCSLNGRVCGIHAPVALVRCPGALLKKTRQYRPFQRPRPNISLQCRAVAEPLEKASKYAAAHSSNSSFSLDGLEAAYSGRRGGEASTSGVYQPAQGEKRYLQTSRRAAQGPIRMKSQPGKSRRGAKRLDTTERLSKVRNLIL